MADFTISEFIAELRQQAGSDIDAIVAEEIAESAEEFMDALRGPSPGQGPTPYDTGRLLTSGDVDVTPSTVEFSNDAAELGRESYASFAHHSGDEVGGYARDAKALFGLHMDERLRERLERRTEEVLRG